MINLYLKDKFKLLDKVKGIDCTITDCKMCIGRAECYKLSQISKYNY